MADKQIKELEKVFAQEAKVDQQQIERAKKEMRKVEKLYKASIKVCNAPYTCETAC